MEENDLTKEDLEKNKLRLEISELSKPWYKRPSNLFPVFTFLIAFGTIIWSFASGFLNVQSQTLTLERKSLEADVRNFSTEKYSLIKQNKVLHDSLINVRNNYKNAVTEFTKQYTSRERHVLDSLSNTTKSNALTNYYKKQLDSLTNLIIKEKAASKALVTENGDYITTEDGRKILLEN